MTPEQLDEIEKLARDPKSAAFHDLMADHTLPLVKALREAREISKVRREEAFDWTSAYFEAQRERDEARAEVERLNKQLDINAAAHRRDVERKDEALEAETYAWSQVRAMRHEMASFNDRAREWGAELGKAMKQLSEAHETIERLKAATNEK